MAENHERYLELAEKWLNGTITEAEEKEYADWYNLVGVDDELLIPQPDRLHYREQMLARIQQRIVETQSTRPTAKNWIARYKWQAAAAILIMSIAGSYLFFTQSTPPQSVTLSPLPQPPVDASPGTNRALLTLADGSSIALDSISNGAIAQQGGTRIFKSSTGEVIYRASANASSSITYNTISTPRGGQYQLRLPDGSQVWLNAASSITFPTAFTGDERAVKITGEAYFEIAKNPGKPFRVAFDDVHVEVLGTGFNINSYSDESSFKTTLLEGSVRIVKGEHRVLLNPGQQADVFPNGAAAQRITIHKDIDVQQVIAWKNGMFQFENTSFEAIMRQLARWYDMEVNYNGMPAKHFGGTISRNVNLSQILKMLELAGEVKFRIEGKKIIATPA